MKKNNEPPKWVNVYPQGTKEGDEEYDFFIALGRSPKWQWRSTAQIAKESGLSRKRVDEILDKYWRKGMVFQSPSNEDHWGYWERVPEMLPKEEISVTEKDHEDRINDKMGKP